MESRLLKCLNDFVSNNQKKLVSGVDEIHFVFDTFWFNKFDQESRKEISAFNGVISDNEKWNEFTRRLNGTLITFKLNETMSNQQTEQFFEFLIEGYL